MSVDPRSPWQSCPKCGAYFQQSGEEGGCPACKDGVGPSPGKTRGRLTFASLLAILAVAVVSFFCGGTTVFFASPKGPEPGLSEDRHGKSGEVLHWTWSVKLGLTKEEETEKRIKKEFQRAGAILPTKPSPEQAQKMLDELWSSYPTVTGIVAFSDEIQFRRVKTRKKIRAILSHYPDWPLGGASGRFTHREMYDILLMHWEYDDAH